MMVAHPVRFWLAAVRTGSDPPVLLGLLESSNAMVYAMLCYAML
jgi:hypothetical protein